MEPTDIPTLLPPNTPFSNVLTCQKCGCHDPSVRHVTYPYIFGFFIFTFRREFQGRWCWKHRFLYHLLAVLISGTFGWLGFPVGLFSTPNTLYRLAKGVGMHKESNLKLLRDLAEEHEQRGFLEDARRCMEASLQFVDDLWGRQQLERFYTLPHREENPGSRRFQPSLAPTGLFASAVLLSGAGGILSHYVDKVYDLPLQIGNVRPGPLFLWIPFAVICLVVIFSLRQIQERILENHPDHKPVLTLMMALAAGGIAAYGFLEGRELGNFLDMLQQHPLLPTGLALWRMLGAVLTRGGLLEITQELHSISFVNSSHHILLAAIPVMFPLTLIMAAWPYLAWERLLHEIRSRVEVEQTVPIYRKAGWVMPYAGFVCLAGLVLLFPQQSRVDFIEARDHFLLGSESMDEGEFDLAISEYQTAVQLDPGYAPAYMDLGWAYYQKDDNTQAIAQYLHSLELDPKRAAAHYDLGKIYYNDDQPEKAEAEFETTLELDPAYHHAYLGLGWVAYDQGNLEKAERDFQKALEYDDKEYDAHVGLGYIFEDRDQLDLAVAAYQKAVESDPEYAEGHLLLGMAYYDKNELDQAVASLEKAVRFEAENRTARLYLTQAYVYTGKPDTAVEFSRETLKLFPDWAAAHALLAFSMIETRQVDAAMIEIQAAKGIAEKTDSDRRLIIQALLNANQVAEAEKEVKEAIQKSQRPSDFYLSLADIYEHQEKYELALTTCDQAAKAGAQEVNVLLQQASIHLDQQKYDLSLEELQQALQRKPKNASVHYLLSRVYSSKDDPVRELDEAQHAVALDRYHYSAYLRVAAAQLTLHDSREAIRAASRAATLAPYADVPHFFLGMAYLQNGQDGAAATELHKFLELYNDFPLEKDLKEEAEDALKKLNRSV
jgi:tetratricopeptide (TPR) repeat protein